MKTNLLKEEKITRREAFGNMFKIAAVVTVAPAIGSLAGCNIFSSKKASAISSGYLPIIDSTPIIVAYEKGFFKEFGLEPSKPTLIRTWPAIIEAFTAKQITLAHIILPQVIFLKYKQNINLRSIAFNHTDVIGMIVSKDIKDLKELGGKMMAVPLWWSAHNGLLQDVLRNLGLTPVVGRKKEDLKSNEVGLTLLPPPDMVEGLKSGLIVGYSISEPFASAGEVLADGRLIKMSGDIWANNPCCQSVLLQETIDKDRPYAQAVANAVHKAALWCHDNMEELADILCKEGGGYFPMPRKVVQRALLKHDLVSYGPNGTGAIMHTEWDVKRSDFNPFPYPSAIDVTVDLMRRTVVDPSVSLPDMFNALTGKQVADDIVEYDLAKKAFMEIEGPSKFNMDENRPFDRDEKYEVLLKNKSLES